MREIKTIEVPTKVIMHFAEDEKLAIASGRRLVYYQVLIDPTNDDLWTMDEEFIRFDHQSSEVHGWQKVESVVIDKILVEYRDEQWKVSNG